CQQYYSYFRTF
nr:immunoglobulin light chain junction region [Macaca mulatta]MOV75101.1 immunoglobulin light chain junction region [Macaca mulatta]